MNLELTAKARQSACEFKGFAAPASPVLGFQASLAFYVGAGGSERRSS